MDLFTLKNALERHREELLDIVRRCDLEREQLRKELADKALQGERFEAMRPAHDEISEAAREYWNAYARVALIDQILEALQGRRERLTLDTAAPILAAESRFGPWAHCAEGTCPPFPPWA